MTYVDNKTGERTYIGTGYSGRGKGLNNPKLQNKQNVGPIPVGTYNIGAAYTHDTLGPITMNLDPREGTNTFDRDKFRIHGDNSKGNKSASHGCIVLPRKIRQQIANCADNELKVVQ